MPSVQEINGLSSAKKKEINGLSTDIHFSKKKKKDVLMDYRNKEFFLVEKKNGYKNIAIVTL